MAKNICITLSGIARNQITGEIKSSIKYSDYDFRDGNLSCNYIWAISDYDFDFESTKNKELFSSYKIISESSLRNDSPIILNYTKGASLRLSEFEGAFPLTEGGNSFSFYRREYELVGRYGDAQPTKIKGQWEPVAINVNTGRLRDFNITSGRSYQYIMYPNSGSQMQQFANANLEENTAHITGAPVKVHWQEWSLTELIPIEPELDAPILKKSYKADINNVWLFKYSLETGSQTQNLTKNEFKTLGQFSKFGYGQSNAISGDVSCLLGSEIVPYSKDRYIERLWRGIDNPSLMSTNQKVDMLNQWRSIAFSKNPKLLRDMKGQAWIVQIVSNSNSPKNFYRNQPDTISFSWKQIDDVDGCIIYGSGETMSKKGQCGSVWMPWSEIKK